MPLLAAALVLLQIPQPSLAQESLERFRRAIGSGVRSNVEAIFARPEDSRYLLAMAERRGGLRKLKVSAIPTPPGWENATGYWAVVHTFQDIEQDHDPVYP